MADTKQDKPHPYYTLGISIISLGVAFAAISRARSGFGPASLFFLVVGSLIMLEGIHRGKAEK